MPDNEVKTIRDEIFFQYAKIIVCSARHCANGKEAKKKYYGFIKKKFHGKVEIYTQSPSIHEDELWEDDDALGAKMQIELDLASMYLFIEVLSTAPCSCE